ncbi:hypothetical protein GCM10009765_54490 [Fodinicola feengrottensis]|uniref:Uncharacterized protein n=1 Tax=Fodinicola feengrottensis TaxID=435914 RepID=A0ABP4U6A7_9ACTN
MDPTDVDGAVQCLHPNPAKSAPPLDRRLYDITRAAIFDAVPTTGRGLLAAALSTEVARRTPPGTYVTTSVGWCTTLVKLDLLARGQLLRVPTEGMPRLLRRPRPRR